MCFGDVVCCLSASVGESNGDYSAVKLVALSEGKTHGLKLVKDASHGSTSQSNLTADVTGCHGLLLK